MTGIVEDFQYLTGTGIMGELGRQFAEGMSEHAKYMSQQEDQKKFEKEAELNTEIASLKMKLKLARNTLESYCYPELLAREIHSKYNDYAIRYGWDIQDSCKCDYDELPSENRAVMYALAKHISEEARRTVEILKCDDEKEG